MNHWEDREQKYIVLKIELQKIKGKKIRKTKRQTERKMRDRKKEREYFKKE